MQFEDKITREDQEKAKAFEKYVEYKINTRGILYE